MDREAGRGLTGDAPDRSVVLRTARAADADAVASVLIASRRAHLPFAPLAHPEAEVRDWVREALVAAGRVVVAERGGRVLALLSTRPASSSPAPDAGIAWIDQLYVLPGQTGQGLGCLLLQHALAQLGRPVRLFTFQANTGARRFYERHGFEAIAFSDGRDNEERCPDVLYEYRGG